MLEYEGIFINEDKRYMTDAEWIQNLEHGIRELKKKIHNLKQEKAELKKDKELLLSDYELLLKDKRELEKENKELKAQIAEYDDLTEELDYRKREAKRLGWNNMNNKQEIHF